MAREKTTWRKSIALALDQQGETFNDVVGTTLTDKQWDKEFSDDFGGSEGCSFTLWTKERVYFPVVYDGSEWVESVPRDPCKEATSHVGGQ